jgi:TetR/AcrR family transcriptional regulator, cholesterol catabolism regulator
MQPEREQHEVAPRHLADRQTRQQILTAAEDLFLAKGYKGVSMKDIAEVVHVKPAALYYHFPHGKEEVFVEILDQVMAETTERALQALASAEDFRERLTLLTQSLLAFPIDRFSLLVRDAHEHLSQRDEHERFFEETGRILLERSAEFFQKAADAGEITLRIPSTILALLHQGMCGSLLNGRRIVPEQLRESSSRQLAEMLVSSLLDGITPSTPTKG